MIKIKIIATGEVKEVTPNIAFGLIDSHEAVRFVVSGTHQPIQQPKEQESTPLVGTEETRIVNPGEPSGLGMYPTRQMRAGETTSVDQSGKGKKRKGYKSK